MGDRESAVVRSIREDKGEYQGVAKCLETFWTTTPIYPQGWIPQAQPTLGGLSDTLPAEQSNSPSQAASDAKVEAPLAGNSHNPNVPGISMAMTPTMVIATTPTTDQELLALHRLLTLVDPREAGRWHWRDGRKVRRGLERFWEDVIASRRTQTPPRKVECNTIISQQDMQSGYKEPVDGAVVEAQGQDQGALSVAAVKVEDDASNDGSARFRTLIFWVYEDLAALANRLDKRVDKMVDRGLIDEIKQLREEAVRVYGSEETIDHQEGIFQSYKEFAHIPTSQLTPTNPLFAPALERMKTATRQYAKRQLKWVEKQLMPVIKQALVHQRQVGRAMMTGEGTEDNGVWVYVVRGGDVDTALGADILRRFLNREPMPEYRTVGHPKAVELLGGLEIDGPSLDGEGKPQFVPDIQQRQVLNARQDCDICSTPGQPVSLLKSEWDIHLRSKTHRRSKHRWERENGLAPDFTAVREEAARRKAAKDEEVRVLRERLEQEDDVGVI
ncbi:hypothetical protein QFC24_006664 [Naganishia onofrii]|uniref:Uncharacterized protein n=1 Tax=Naganishia onofrii TaxID=1851511 RepID=A0ACC2WZ44_9TREE|nr:hypothetical protein QFC24_006664 [Naganishia onofrii]